MSLNEQKDSKSMILRSSGGTNGKNLESLEQRKLPRGWARWKSRKVFAAYLSRLTKGGFWLTEAGISITKSLLRPWQRKELYKRLREIDPEGFRSMVILSSVLSKKRNMEKKLPMRKEEQKGIIEIEQLRYEAEGITHVRFVQAEAVLDIVAHMRAAGYTKQEIIDKTGFDEALVNKVTPSMITRMRQVFNESIVRAADQKVYHDLIEGNISNATVRADNIATKRRKLVIDAAKAMGKNVPASPARAERKKEELYKRFGVTVLNEENKEKEEES